MTTNIAIPTIFAAMENVLTKQPCALCGIEERPAEVDAHIEGPWPNLVCFDCTKKHAPDLAESLDWYWREVNYAYAAYDFVEIGMDVFKETERLLGEDRHGGAYEVARLAQMIACLRLTCGGDDGSHEHVTLKETQS